MAESREREDEENCVLRRVSNNTKKDGVLFEKKGSVTSLENGAGPEAVTVRRGSSESKFSRRTATACREQVRLVRWLKTHVVSVASRASSEQSAPFTVFSYLRDLTVATYSKTLSF